MNPTLRYLSLGAGRQSTALYLMACDGVFGDERPTVAIFSDTQDEPADVYRHLDRLERDFGHVIPIRRVTRGKLSADLAESKRGSRIANPPFYVATAGTVEEGTLRRQCTREYKVEPIQREVRAMLGAAKGERLPKDTRVESWQGISLDEASRMRDAREWWVSNRYPLIFDHPMTADQCAEYNARRGYAAAKSACVFCPYTSDARWRTMKQERPDDFAEAVRVDEMIRVGIRGVSGEAFVHRSLIPLADVDFRNAEDLGQGNLFENECEGMCGV